MGNGEWGIRASAVLESALFFSLCVKKKTNVRIFRAVSSFLILLSDTGCCHSRPWREWLVKPLDSGLRRNDGRG